MNARFNLPLFSLLFLILTHGRLSRIIFIIIRQPLPAMSTTDPNPNPKPWNIMRGVNVSLNSATWTWLTTTIKKKLDADIKMVASQFNFLASCSLPSLQSKKYFLLPRWCNQGFLGIFCMASDEQQFLGILPSHKLLLWVMSGQGTSNTHVKKAK